MAASNKAAELAYNPMNHGCLVKAGRRERVPQRRRHFPTQTPVISGTAYALRFTPLANRTRGDETAAVLGCGMERASAAMHR